MAGKGVKVFTAGTTPRRKVTVNPIPTKQLNNRKVFVAKDITLNARFSMLSSMRQHASQQQSERRDSVLAKKRGLKPAAGPSQSKETGKGKGNGSKLKKSIAVGSGFKVRPTAVARRSRKPAGKRRGGKAKKGDLADQ